VVHVYDLVDWVTEAGFSAGDGAGKFAIAQKKKAAQSINLIAGNNVRYVVPHRIEKENLKDEPIRLQMRVRQPMEEPVWVEVHDGDNLITRKGERYVRPGEMVTVTLKPKDFDAIRKTDRLTVQVVPR